MIKKKLAFREGLILLKYGPSLSRTTLPFMWDRISAVCDRHCRIEGLWPGVWDVKKLPVRPKPPDLIEIENMSKSKAQPTICLSPKCLNI